MQTPLNRRARCKENARSGGYLPCLLMLTVVTMINDITAASNFRPRSISWSYQSGRSLTFAFLQDLNSLPHLQSQTLSHWASEVADDCGENERDGKRWDPRKTEKMITAADALTFVEHARNTRKRLRHERSAPELLDGNSLFSSLIKGRYQST